MLDYIGYHFVNLENIICQIRNGVTNLSYYEDLSEDDIEYIMRRLCD